ncbi:hypothetical protein MUK42_09771, partial [Musa troglodytarum]
RILSNTTRAYLVHKQHDLRLQQSTLASWQKQSKPPPPWSSQAIYKEELPLPLTHVLQNGEALHRATPTVLVYLLRSLSSPLSRSCRGQATPLVLSCFILRHMHPLREPKHAADVDPRGHGARHARPGADPSGRPRGSRVVRLPRPPRLHRAPAQRLPRPLTPARGLRRADLAQRRPHQPAHL